jgi:predicted  nucleic acid-binding Zn-ribbon protein
MSQTFKLYRLQQLDSQLDQNNARLFEIEKALSDRRELQQAEKQFAAATEALNEASAAVRRSEEDVKAQRIKIEQNEATLYGGKVRNPKELQDLQNEGSALKRYLGVLEDRQLEKMIAQEEAQEELAQAAQHLEQERTRSEATGKELYQEKAVLEEEVKRLQAERQAAASSTTREELDLYNQLRQQRRGIAVARVTDTYCSACGSTLSAALLHAARLPNQIARCDTCGRILYAG